MKEELIAPCGMNCALCSSYLAREYDIKSRGVKMPYCAGCRPRGKQCAFLKKSCRLLMNGDVKYCYECPDFPCRRLQTIDKRYSARYRMSMVSNLNYIKEHGLPAFFEAEEKKWRCSRCGGVICCHNGLCFKCDLDALKTRKQVYRWEDE